jgi:protein-S-isoprenylcysteine O-methyltransferase
VITVVLGVAALLAWVGFEVVLRRPGEASTLQPGATDRASTSLLVTAYNIAALLPLVLWRVGLGSIGDAAWAGVALAAGGLALRAWGMLTLGAAYSRTLRTTSEQGLVTTGPYRWIRHPGYLGSIAVWVGAALAFHSWLAAALVAGLMLVAYGWRIRAEEQMLARHFGDAFTAYASRTARLVPGIY